MLRRAHIEIASHPLPTCLGIVFERRPGFQGYWKQTKSVRTERAVGTGGRSPKAGGLTWSPFIQYRLAVILGVMSVDCRWRPRSSAIQAEDRPHTSGPLQRQRRRVRQR